MSNRWIIAICVLVSATAGAAVADGLAKWTFRGTRDDVWAYQYGPAKLTEGTRLGFTEGDLDDSFLEIRGRGSVELPALQFVNSDRPFVISWSMREIQKKTGGSQTLLTKNADSGSWQITSTLSRAGVISFTLIRSTTEGQTFIELSSNKITMAEWVNIKLTVNPTTGATIDVNGEPIGTGEVRSHADGLTSNNDGLSTNFRFGARPGTTEILDADIRDLVFAYVA